MRNKEEHYSTHRPGFCEPEDGSALQRRHHGHDCVQVVHVAQFLGGIRQWVEVEVSKIRMQNAFWISCARACVRVRARTLAVRMYKLNTSALIFNVCACRISRTTQKLVWKEEKKKGSLKKRNKNRTKHKHRCPCHGNAGKQMKRSCRSDRRGRIIGRVRCVFRHF